MDSSSLLGVWTGTAHNSNGWDMKVTISIIQPFDRGSLLGVFDIPLLPCAGVFRVIDIRGETIHLKAEKVQGECVQAEEEFLDILPDGTLLYVSKGRGWETRGVLFRNDEIFPTSLLDEEP